MLEQETQSIVSELRAVLDLQSSGPETTVLQGVAYKVSKALNEIRKMGVTLEELGFSQQEKAALESLEDFYTRL